VALVAAHPSLSEAFAPNPDGFRRAGDATFTSHGLRVGHDASLMGARLPTHADTPFQLGAGAVARWSARFAPSAPRPSRGTTTRARRLPGAWPSTDLVVAAGRRGVEWMLVLADERAPTSFAWKVDLGAG